MTYVKRVHILLTLLVLALFAGTASAATEDNDFSLKLPACKKNVTAWKQYLAEGNNKDLSRVNNPLWTDLDGDGQCDVVVSMEPEFTKANPEGKLTFPWTMKNYGCEFFYKNGKFDTKPAGNGTLNCSEAEYSLHSAMPIYSKIAKKTFLIVFEYTVSSPGLGVFGNQDIDANYANFLHSHSQASAMRFYLRSLLRLQRDFIATYRKKLADWHGETQGQVAADMFHDEIDGVTGHRASDLFAVPEEQADKLVEQIRAEVDAEPIGTGTGIHP